MSSSPNVPVLIVGAGPTGLVLALTLAKRGVRFRLIDKATEAGTSSRALVIHARTLEFYEQLGIAEPLIEDAVKFSGAHLWVKGRERARLILGDLGKGISPFPFLTVYPQDRHEAFLVGRLAELGLAAERGVTLEGLTQDADGTTVQLRHADGRVETGTARYVAGCDGARSKVREILGTGFEGGTYPTVFYVADVEGNGPVLDGELHLALDEADFVAIFPMAGAGRGRLVGQINGATDEQIRKLKWEDVSKNVLRRLNFDVLKVFWFSTYHIHHRVASHFRQGRAFLLGDAGHIHSPVGGQGMNTGIGDAINLGWKLADVLEGRAPESLLDTYEPERIEFARRLVNTTDRAFRFVTSPGRFARFLRTVAAPWLLPLLLRIRAIKLFAYRTVSQTAIHYRHAAWSVATHDRITGGNRLPWNGDNYVPLTSLDWQVHVYGEDAGEKKRPLEKTGLPVHAFALRPEGIANGLLDGAAYLVRPDGYLALVAKDGGADTIVAYLATKSITAPT